MSVSSREREMIVRLAENLPAVGKSLINLVDYVEMLEEAYEEEHEANLALYEELCKLSELTEDLIN